MEYSKEIFLNTTTQSFVGGYPFTLTVNPSSVDANHKISKIVYNFDEEIVVRYFDFINDIDPRYYLQEHIFNFSGEITKTYHINIEVHQFGQSAINFSVTLNLNGSDSGTNSYISNLHLIKSRMFGPKNDMLYIFESQGINGGSNILPVLVNYQ